MAIVAALLWVVVLLVVLYIIKLVLDAIPGIPLNIKQIVLAVIGLIALVLVIEHFLPLLGRV